MGLWVRSQHKETLIKVNNFFANDLFVCGNGIALGKYSTKEKALKVLDFIEKKITENNNAIVCDNERYVKYFVKNAGNKNQVLQMPLDSEVEE